MSTQAARALVRLGLVLLPLALFARLGGPSKANLIGADLALLSSACVVVFGIAYLRLRSSRDRIRTRERGNNTGG
ncbi:MAG TPA: hypothetical protein VHX59_08915 [Mycobacteriales bacterium]|jgi:hypothetical protein|nr:hypothetical protein [Mycobacteriales bacterium]